jgi:hypothetical protein
MRQRYPDRCAAVLCLAVALAIAASACTATVGGGDGRTDPTAGAGGKSGAATSGPATSTTGTSGVTSGGTGGQGPAPDSDGGAAPPWQPYDSGGLGTQLLDHSGWMAHATIHYEGSDMRAWEGKQGYPPPDAVDGDPETFWEAGMHQDTYGQRLDQWFLVDLRFSQKFSRLVLDSSTCHPVDSNGAYGMMLTNPTNNYPRQFKIEASQDGKTFTVVNPSATGTSDVTDVSFAEQTAQFLRLSILKVVDFPTTWVICELRLYR